MFFFFLQGKHYVSIQVYVCVCIYISVNMRLWVCYWGYKTNYM